MGKFQDLTGKRFGQLVVLDRADDHVSKSGYRSTVWKCRCDCGNTTFVRASYLNSGNTKSCGCLVSAKHPERVKDITGIRFGRLTAVRLVDCKSSIGAVWEVKCDCGKVTEVPYRYLHSGNTKSCGCLKDEKLRTNGHKHGGSDKRLYTVWAGMKQRCTNKSHKSYKDYGGRGISYCEEWEDFAVFEKWSMENGYDPDAMFGKCTLDRIDVNGDYTPSNCRWVDLSTQANNRRTRK